jgi:hypothetical protein
MFATLLLLGACGGPAFDPSGVWLFRVDEDPDAPETCTDEVFHNLTGASPPAAAAEDTGWTVESSATWSERVAFGQITAAGDGFLLLLDGESLPEAGAGDGAQRTFQWTRREASTSDIATAAGYSWAEDLDRSTTTRVILAMPDERIGRNEAVTLGGFWEQDSLSSASWQESDTWPADITEVGEAGQLPAATYLEVPSDDTGGGAAPASNGRDAVDCDQTPCVLRVSQSCLLSHTLQAERTALDPSDVAWEDAGWSSGL